MIHCRLGEGRPMGALVTGEREVQFTTLAMANQEQKLLLYHKRTGRRREIVLEKQLQRGNVYSVVVEGIRPEEYAYNYSVGGQEVTDPYARVILGNERWGSRIPRTLWGGISTEKCSREADRMPMTPFEESLLYLLHVRGFTQHGSSGVKMKGTFEGICEKLPYLKELGITALELMPCYEFLEQEEDKINYWGYKRAYYFAPKASYSASGSPEESFSQLVKTMHDNGIEMILQFYFPASVPDAFMLEVVRFWIRRYHIDGVRLLGAQIPIELFASDPECMNVKLLYRETAENLLPAMFGGRTGAVARPNLGTYHEGFMYQMRSFLKGDPGVLRPSLDKLLESPSDHGNVVYMTNYDTFTLLDLVSYQRKHNEENGEEGRDGSNHNVSWNCGAEGPTRRKEVLTLRRKQRKNALCLLLLSKGTPVLLAGDEFGNSQKGNNNPYCQDNEISWLDWKHTEKERDFLEFTKELIRLRRKCPAITQVCVPGKGADNSFPPLSLHGKEAWKPEWVDGRREACGILHYREGTFVYVCLNMLWEKDSVAIPNLPLSEPWEILLSTEEKNDIAGDRQQEAVLMPRSILVMASREKEDRRMAAGKEEI